MAEKDTAMLLKCIVIEKETADIYGYTHSFSKAF